MALDLDQAHYASIVVGLSVRRGLPPRAASIAMATVYQETGIRNLDYGDRDSVGLFQQRPSQGWGTPKQLMDPYYATGKFYDALVKIDDWETGDINDVAQKVQRSGYPEAYRDHEERRPGAGQHPDRPLPRRLHLPGPHRDRRRPGTGCAGRCARPSGSIDVDGGRRHRCVVEAADRAAGLGVRALRGGQREATTA